MQCWHAPRLVSVPTGLAQRSARYQSHVDFGHHPRSAHCCCYSQSQRGGRHPERCCRILAPMLSASGASERSWGDASIRLRKGWSGGPLVAMLWRGLCSRSLEAQSNCLSTKQVAVPPWWLNAFLNQCAGTSQRSFILSLYLGN